jgi:beta-mannosidase
VNDTREEKSGTVVIRDVDSGEIIFSSLFKIPVNSKTVIGNILRTQKQTMWLIDYTVEVEKYTNHYLVGETPFKLEDYQRWYHKLGIKEQTYEHSWN